MLSYTAYSEAGGVGKTTTAANLAIAHARAGLDVLVVPLDPQDGDFSHLFAVDDDRDSEEVDTLVRHLVDRPWGEFDELIRSAEGVDIVPEHNMLSDLGEHLRREQQAREGMGESFGIYARLLSVLREAGIHEEYDVLICDPPASEGPHLYNAINATRNLAMPVEPSPKGEASVEGLADLVTGLEATLDVEIGVLAAVPTGFKDTAQQAEILDSLEYPAPEVIRERASMMEGTWSAHCSAFQFVRKHRDRMREYELDTLAKYDRLARFLEDQADVTAPNPPEPGDLEHGRIEA